MKKILFVCVENAGRSQIAEAFAKKYGAAKVVVSSAGNKPANKVNAVVVEVMKEKGIDLSKNTQNDNSQDGAGCRFDSHNGLQ